jgi:hypothetical protein
MKNHQDQIIKKLKLKTIIKEQAGLIWLVTYVNQTSEFE